MHHIYWWNCLFHPPTPCAAQTIKMTKGITMNYVPLGVKNVYIHFHQITKLLRKVWENPPLEGPHVAHNANILAYMFRPAPPIVEYAAQMKRYLGLDKVALFDVHLFPPDPLASFPTEFPGKSTGGGGVPGLRLRPPPLPDPRRASSTLGCLRAWRFPLHFLASDSARPHHALCPLPRRLRDNRSVVPMVEGDAEGGGGGDLANGPLDGRTNRGSNPRRRRACSEDSLGLKPGYAVGDCHARRLPSVREAAQL